MKPELPTDLYVKKNPWWVAECPKHGKTEHGEVINGRCFQCQAEKTAPK